MWLSIHLTGPWRWFDESMLDCCEPLENVKTKGISFGKVVCLAHCAGAKVEAFRSNQTTIDEFRKHVMRCSISDNCHVISSYHRSAFKQVSNVSSFDSISSSYSLSI
jgi:glutathione gamma-glutamylcysteinyltransferase